MYIYMHIYIYVYVERFFGISTGGCCCPIDPRSDALEQVKTVALARA